MRSFIFLRISMSSSNKLPLKKLTENFYIENSGLLEVLDKDLGQGWKSSSKVRGYGIILISINSLTFGIPLRSNIKHKQAFFTTPKTDNDQYGRKGLDYSKAVLITDNNYIDNSSFRIHVTEFDRIQDNHAHIKAQFEKYIERYIDTVTKKDIHKMRLYSYSTLKNYHQELGIKNSTDDTP